MYYTPSALQEPHEAGIITPLWGCMTVFADFGGVAHLTENSQPHVLIRQLMLGYCRMHQRDHFSRPSAGTPCLERMLSSGPTG